jgi:hypothetical protein
MWQLHYRSGPGIRNAKRHSRIYAIHVIGQGIWERVLYEGWRRDDPKGSIT